MVRGELGKADKFAECGLSLDLGDSGMDAVGGIVAPIVQNMQRSFELSGDGRSRFADDVGSDAGTAARVLVHFEHLRFVSALCDGDGEQNGLRGSTYHGASGKIVSGAIRSDGFDGSLGETGAKPSTKRGEDFGKPAHVQVGPL